MRPKPCWVPIKRTTNSSSMVNPIVAPVMYKTIMRLATLDDNATVIALRTNLCEFTQYAVKQNENIDEINIYFDQNWSQLKR